MCDVHGPIAQRLEQATHNRLVAGSNPAGPTTSKMAWVYILLGSGGRHYIGSTTDLDRRLDQHRSGHTYSTRPCLFLVPEPARGAPSEHREDGKS